MRGRTIELESELERLRRQLTSERFDKYVLYKALHDESCH